MSKNRFLITCLVALAAAVWPHSEVKAELVLSQLVVDLNSAETSRADLEVWNNGSERTYVAVEPREVVNPGTPGETRREEPDPEQLGLLVSPARMILEPGERKLLRVANIAASAERERVYRVTVRPVVGQLSTTESGLKVLLGYDVLVLVRPLNATPKVTGTRSGDRLTLRNVGNISVELLDGEECAPSGRECTPLKGARLYAGAEKEVRVAPLRTVKYKLKTPGELIPAKF